MIDEMVNDENAHETIARLHKVCKLMVAIDVLTERDWDLALTLARRMNDEQWEGLAHRADVRPPSRTTRRELVDALARRLDVERRLNAKPGQPFVRWT